MPEGKGWKNEPAGSLERMTHAMNVYRAFKMFEERGEMTVVEFTVRYLPQWKIIVDVERMEKAIDD